MKTKEELKNNIIKNDYIRKDGLFNSVLIRHNKIIETEFYKEIHQNTLFVPFENITEKFYCILNNITTKKLCPYCQTPVKFKMFKYGYKKTCGKNTCIRQQTLWKSSSAKKIVTNKIIYNNFCLNYESKQYNIVDINKIKEFVSNRILETQSGVLHMFIDNKHIKENSEILYNILDLTKEFVVVNKSNFKWSERFYIIHNNITEQSKCLLCNNKTPYINFKKGYQKTCGINCSNNGYANKQRIKNHIYNIKETIEKQNFEIINNLDLFNGLNNEKLKLKCKKCNNIIEKDLSNSRWEKFYCNICNNFTSNEEKEVLAFIKEKYNKTILNNIKHIENKELDIYLPENNLAIEYNGIYYHSYNNQQKENKKYHLNKTELCLKKNIKLLHIFSHEWSDLNKQEIWKSIILNKLGVSNRIFARKCMIKELDNKTKNAFLNNNHLQGEDKTSIKIGLFYNNELISVMTFSKTRFNKNYEWELVRFCNKLNTTIIGGASKLLTYFEKTYKPKSLITYADRRYSTGELYYKLGFTFIKNTPPNYIYYKRNLFLSRMQTQKHKLEKLLVNFNKNITESENMFNHGYRRFWDCGNMSFQKSY